MAYTFLSRIKAPGGTFDGNVVVNGISNFNGGVSIGNAENANNLSVFGTISCSGGLTSASGLTVENGGLTVENGGLTVTKGELTVGSGVKADYLKITRGSNTNNYSVTFDSESKSLSFNLMN